MDKKYLLLPFIFLFCAISFLWFAGKRQKPSQNLQVLTNSQEISFNVNSSAVSRIGDWQFSLNQPEFDLLPNIDNYFDLIAGSGIKTIRYQAGCGADSFDWRTNTIFYGNNTPRKVGPSLAYNLDTIRRHGFKSIYVLNLYSFPFFTDTINICGYPVYKSYNDPANPRTGLADLIDLIEYLDKAPGVDLNDNGFSGGSLRRQDGIAEGKDFSSGFDIKYFELGNEHWGTGQWKNCESLSGDLRAGCFAHFMQGDNPSDGQTGLANISGLIAQTIKTYIPDAYVIAQSINSHELGQDIWVNAMLADPKVQSYVDAFQEHSYCAETPNFPWGGDGRSLDDYFDVFFIPYILDKRYGLNGDFRQAGKDFWITEYNLYCWGDPGSSSPKVAYNPATGTLENGLFTLNMLRVMNQYGLKGSAYHASHGLKKTSCGEIIASLNPAFIYQNNINVQNLIPSRA